MRINDIKRILLIFLFSLIFISCSSVKQEEKKSTFSDKNLIWQRYELKTISFKADADIEFSGSSLSAVIKGKIANKDSASFVILGPFGITVAKAYIAKDYVLFYDSYNNKYFSADVNKISEIKNTNIGLYIQMVKKLFDLMRNEYIKTENITPEYDIVDYIAFKNINKDQSSDVIEFSKNTNLISKITNFRNNSEDFSVKYTNFESYENIMFPGKMEFKYNKLKMSMKMEFTELKLNLDFSSIPFIFSVPSGAEKINF
jgi:hypothetical protein